MPSHTQAERRKKKARNSRKVGPLLPREKAAAKIKRLKR